MKQLSDIGVWHTLTILETMAVLQRKTTYRCYPSAAQIAALENALALHCRVHNTLLEEHRRRFEAGEPSYTFPAMCRDLTQWRRASDALAGLSAQALQVTAKRVSLAFTAFFRRVAAGETPGYPRFKALARHTGWGYKTHGDGWRLLPGDGRNARVRLSGIGEVPLRGRARFGGTPKIAEILHKNGKWYLSVTFDVAPAAVARVAGTGAAAFDWGVGTLLTIATGDGRVETVDNPRWLKNRLAALQALGRAVAAEEARIRAVRGLAADAVIGHAQFSARLKRLRAQERALHGRIARQRSDFYHKLTSGLVGRYGYLASEQLAVKAMTATPKAKPDPDAPGEHLPNGAAAKAGLNRGILDAAPSMLLGMLRTKAEEAGSEFALANTRVVKPTQRCHRCGAIVKKALSERRHKCACGCECGRDENAAKTLLRWSLEGMSWFAPGTGAARA